FDSAGLTVSAVLRVEGQVLLWYTGMRLAVHVPYELAVGLAVSDDDGLTFRKAGTEPVMVSSTVTPSFITTPFVRRGAAGGFEMWYSSGTGWRATGDKLEPYYDIRHATSPDGRTWTPSPGPVVGL